ncbi:hypothetical protein [Rhodococcus sp. B50]|uniref:hypothetical protein n=1 Tax=Rhodococcus sp. B50 TaxID=2682847 RepID=UPI001FD58C24|nr:hypothetical protein [Rhodococcus sp. B50]MBS9376052.1 hypothetical protein [Rhodococcus sp. B50]
MSEYQYYEFLVVDRPLNKRQLAEVRSLSTRARITATSFVNEYHWGNFRGEPRNMMERYYDAHLYLANWGTHRIMLRLPQGLLDLDVARDYCVADLVTAWTTGEFLVLDLTSEDEDGDWDPDDDAPLSTLIGSAPNCHGDWTKVGSDIHRSKLLHGARATAKPEPRAMPQELLTSHNDRNRTGPQTRCRSLLTRVCPDNGVTG